jgi:Pretoxin HINT domain
MSPFWTPDGHPFWVDGKGWVHASRLTGGQYLVQSDGESSIVLSSVHEAHPGGVAIFNLEVEGLHNYFVSEDSGFPSILVHNTSDPTAEELVQQFQELRSRQMQQAASMLQQVEANVRRTRLEASQLRQIYDAISRGEISNMAGELKMEVLEGLDYFATQYESQIVAWENWLTHEAPNIPN